MMIKAAAVTAATLSLALAAGPALAATPTGSVQVALTGPRSVDLSRQVAMTCTTTGSTYRMLTTAVAKGVTVAVSVVVPHTSGAGTYPTSTVTVAVTGAAHKAVVPRTVTRFPVVLTATGGLYSFTGHLPSGKSLAGAVSWTCPSV